MRLDRVHEQQVRDRGSNSIVSSSERGDTLLIVWHFISSARIETKEIQKTRVQYMEKVISPTLS